VNPRIAIRTLLFTVVVPGTVLAWAPWFLIAGPERVAAHWPPATTDAASVAQVAMIAFGTFTYLLCALRFAFEGQGTPDPLAPPKKLVTGGLYRFTRNPMYVGVVIALAGEAWWLASPAMAIYAAIVAIAFHLRVVIYEEPALRRLFGTDFDVYRARVKRWGLI
jgi:protein-S-isoprenylcysteine O-methyltransferase Ste14